jgi:hypothetical protein
MSGHWPTYPVQPLTGFVNTFGPSPQPVQPLTGFVNTFGPSPQPIMRWVVKQSAGDDGDYVYELSRDGWEPFAVTTGPSASPRIWWRKQVDAA